jgi:tetratricopeptide (TPR) repeat protein
MKNHLYLLRHSFVFKIPDDFIPHTHAGCKSMCRDGLLSLKSRMISSRTLLLDARVCVGIIFFLFSSLLSFTPLLSGQDSTETDRKINFYIFNGQGRIADSLIDKELNSQPENLKYYFFKSQNSFYMSYFNTFGIVRDSLVERVYESAGRAIALGEEREMTIENMFYLGSAYGYMARYYAGKAAYWDAFWAARSARSYLSQVLDEDSSFADARQELAVQSYFTSRLDGLLGFLAWLTGMRGDARQALKEFQIVADQGRLCKDEARFVLFNLYMIEDDFRKALALGEAFLADFPDNVFVRVQTMSTKIVYEQGDLDFLKSEYDSLKSKYHLTNPAILNDLGYILMSHHHFEDAFKALHTNIRLFPHVANGYDSLSEAYLITGNVDMAIHYSKLCLEKLPFDSTITDAERRNLQSISEKRLENLGVDSGKKMI